MDGASEVRNEAVVFCLDRLGEDVISLHYVREIDVYRCQLVFFHDCDLFDVNACTRIVEGMILSVGRGCRSQVHLLRETNVDN